MVPGDPQGASPTPEMVPGDFQGASPDPGKLPESRQGAPSRARISHENWQEGFQTLGSSLKLARELSRICGRRKKLARGLPGLRGGARRFASRQAQGAKSSSVVVTLTER